MTTKASNHTKCSSTDSQAEPFYLIQSNNEGKRYVISLHDIEQIKTILSTFINGSRNLQLKIRDLDNQENPIDYNGEAKRGTIHKAIKKFEGVIFSNGYFDLMIRNPKTGDYIVYDEHGLIFLYSDEDYRPVIEKLTVISKPNEKLIYEFNHWHRKKENGSEQLVELIKFCGLK